MKIGIITLFGLYNYGNRLQNLAVIELLQRKGHTVETIVCEKFRWRTLLKTAIYRLCFWKPVSKRNREFEKFNAKYIHVNHLYRKDSLIPWNVGEDYDAFVVGSDQVWNPEIRRNEKPNFYLEFAPDYKRICLSPSIGVSTISEKYEDEIKKGLSGFKYLSCRETQGSEEMRRITGRECETLIDPTLALDAEYWRSIADYTVIPKEKYVCCIFLGAIAAEIKTAIKSYADLHKCQIVNIMASKSPFYEKGPDCFISLIDRAEMIFTDSFHAVAFSINFNTSFYAFEKDRKNGLSSGSSRILSITKKFGLEDRFSSIGFDDSVGIDFVKVNETLGTERKKIHQYLDKALKYVEK